MQQKEVLIIIGVLVVGFLLLQKGNLFSGRATYADTLNYVTEPNPYGGGAGLGTDPTEVCPPATILYKDCTTLVDVVKSIPFSEFYGEAIFRACTQALTDCDTCTIHACDDLTEQCNTWCGYDPNGPNICLPIVSCSRPTMCQARSSETRCGGIGIEIASCRCRDLSAEA